MANTIQIKRGANASLPTLAAGELGFSTDTYQVHVGDGATNHELVMHNLFTAQTVLAATTSGTPAALTVDEQTLVGRLTGGDVAAISLGISDNNVVQIDDADAADNDLAKFTANGLEGRSYAEVLGDLSGQAAADFAMNTHKITGVIDPTAAQDAATKNYVDALTTGLDLHASSKVATTEALPTCSGTGTGVGKILTADTNGVLTIDGIATVLNDRILVKDQVTGADNGIYKVTTEGTAGVPFVLTRATDFDQDAEVTPGAFTFIEEGTANGDEGWILTTNATITVDTTSLTFTQFSSAAEPISAFTGLSDTPANYTAAGLKICRVNTGADALEFVTFSSTYLDDTAGGVDAETGKAPTANVMYDHAVAATGVHGVGAETILHSGSTIDGGSF